MGSNRFKHNKKRNSGLIYEFLVRKMAQAVLEKDSGTYKKSLNILKKYYSKGQPLNLERQIFEEVISTRGVDENIARGIINEVVVEAKNLNLRLVDIKKSNLIKDIHITFGKDFFSQFRLLNYKAYASTQLLINGCSNSTLKENVERVQLKEALTKFMSSKVSENKDEVCRDADAFVYKLAVKKFNERYNDTLNDRQKQFLKEYIVALSSPANVNNKRVQTLLENERKTILGELNNHGLSLEIANDKKLKSKFISVKKQLAEIDYSKNSSSQIEEMMLYHKLLQELKSDE